tara:strand:- start:2950 stop:3240 length:291 start_codon:yes stop_codon:yes gene_type:complete
VEASKVAKKRERLEVIFDILSAIRDEHNNIRPTRLLYRSNLSPQMFKEYTQELVEKGFVEKKELTDGNKSFTLTKKGFEFLEKYQVIIGFIHDFGL